MVQLVTGGAGFIGSHLVEALLATGDEVVAIDNLANGKLAYLERAMLNSRFRFVKADCSNLDEFQLAVDNSLSGHRASALWHMAANSDIPAGVANPQIDLRDTFMTTFNALLVMQRFDIPSFQFASSSAIYGDCGDKEIAEDTAPYRPISYYGAMKLASEAQISAALESFGRRANIFRFPNVVGAPATHGVIFDFIGRLHVNPKRLEVLGNGTQQKAYLHVRDLIDAMLFIAKRDIDKVAILNIGPNDAGVTVRSIAEWVCETVSPKAEIGYGHEDRGWVGDVPKFRYSTRRLMALGWQPSMNSEAAVRAAISEIAGS